MRFISELIGYPLGGIMWLIYSLLHNYGLAILIFTVIVRLILFPLSVKQQKSTAAMAAFQPKLDKLKKQYANNQQKLQEEQMKLYAEEDINPMASCLPMVFQLFFLYGVFDVVYRPLTHILRMSKETVSALTEIVKPLYEGNNYFQSRPEIYILQSAQDHPELFTGVDADVLEKMAGFNNKLFGLVDLGAIPKTIFEPGHVWDAAAVGLLLIPILSGVIQLIMTFYSTSKQKKLNPEASAQMGSMNIMLYMMPLFSIWMAFSFPAGIGFYWICSSLVGVVQMVVLNKIYTPEYVAKLVEKDKAKKKNKKRSGFMEKYNEMLKEQMQMQNGGQPAAPEKKKITATGINKDDDESGDVKLSKSQMKEYERKIIAEARRRQAEKYGDEYSSDDKD